MADPIVIPLAMPLSERIELVRDFDRELSDETIPSDRIRRRLFAGEAVNAQDAVEEYDVSIGLVAGVVSALQPWGYEFERVSEDRDGKSRSTYRLLNPDHTPDWDSPPPKKKRARKRASSQRTAPSPTERPATPVRRAMAPDSPAAVSSLPALGEEVMVSALLLDDGAVRIGLKSANGRAWVARLEGAGA